MRISSCSRSSAAIHDSLRCFLHKVIITVVNGRLRCSAWSFPVYDTAVSSRRNARPVCLWSASYSQLFLFI
ncbi:unnamed protein product [Rotaria socialis]